MVVTDADLSVGPALLRVLRRGITRVQIAGNEIGLEGVEREVVGQRAPLVGQAGGVVQVADVLREHALPVAHQRESILQVTAERQHLGAVVEALGQRQRRRGIATRAPHHPQGTADDAPDRVVHPPLDRTVVVEHPRDGGAQAGRSIVQPDRLRLFAQVAAGQHDRRLAAPHQQQVQRGVRQHHAERGQAGCDAVGQRCIGAPRQQHDRRCRAGERGFGHVVAQAPLARHFDVTHQQREGLAFAALECSQPRYRVGACRVASDLVAAQALDQHQLAAAQQRSGAIRVVERGQGLQAKGLAVQPAQRGARAAGVAGHCLGVEAPVVGVGVLARAGRAQREGRHRRVRAVVGGAFEHTEARAAGGARGERIAIAARERIQRLGATRRADGPVGRHAEARLRQRAVGDRERRRQRRRHGERLREQCIDTGAAVVERAQALLELGERRLRAKGFDDGHRAFVVNAAHHAERARQAQRLRSEADPLNDAAHLQACAAHRRPMWSIGQRCGRGHSAHHATSHNRTRLLPESTMIAVLP
mmetsp:Transcript_4958/g.17983  ORF Transcript_4958/g.17983 Transcript_4958/m.17983 type:complete len:532 (-) Transcript_4958:871-2466(-)